MAISSFRSRQSLGLQRLLFLALWMLANVLPWVGGWLVYKAFPVEAIAWLVACLGVGIAQWFVLQRRISGLESWPMVTLVGGILGAIGLFAFIFAPLVAPLSSGLAVGVAQWTVLRRKVRRAAWWILGTTAGAGIGLLTYLFFPFSLGGGLNQTELLVFRMGLIIEVMSSLVTGPLMLWLLQRKAPPRNEPEAEQS